jgi:hypothetical protein
MKWFLCCLISIAILPASTRTRVEVLQEVRSKTEHLWPTLLNTLVVDQGLKIFVIGWCTRSLSVKCFDERQVQVWEWAPSFTQLSNIAHDTLRKIPPRLVLSEHLVSVVWPECFACVDRGVCVKFELGEFVGVWGGGVCLRRRNRIWNVHHDTKRKIAPIPPSAIPALYQDCLCIYHINSNTTDIYCLSDCVVGRYKRCTISGCVVARVDDVFLCKCGRKYKVSGDRMILCKK